MSSQGSFTGDELVLMPLDEAERMLSLQMALKLADLGVRCAGLHVTCLVAGWVGCTVRRVVTSCMPCDVQQPAQLSVRCSFSNGRKR